MKTTLVIDQQKAIEQILQELYFSEFEVVDNYNCHPQGISFYRWLFNKHLISAENLAEIEAEIKANKEDEPAFEDEPEFE